MALLHAALLVCALAVTVADPIIRALPELQVASGGFHEIGTDAPDIEATASGLFLAALYGQTTQINADDAAQYVQSLQSASDHGYGHAAGMPSSLEATRLALECYLHLGRDIPASAQTGEYIRSLFNVNNGLFASQVGGEGDLKATALAVEALEILGELRKPAVQEMLKRTKDLLAERVVSSGTSLSFVLDPDSTTPVSDNYYGLFLATRSGFEFEDKDKWAQFILALQDADELSATRGGFFSSTSRGAVTAEATAHATRSLTLLGKDLGVVASKALLQYTQTRKFSIKETAQSHFALAHTSIFKGLFQIRLLYDPIDESTSQFVQGMRVTPIVRVTVFDNTVVHGGFTINVSEEQGWTTLVPFDPSTNHYIATSELETADRLGEVVFTFNMATKIFPIGDIKFEHKDSKRVGYRITVDDSATIGGRALETDESVLPGTEFVFGIALATETDEEILTGDFELVFSVKDASNAIQHTETLDGSKNAKAFRFAYSLSGDDFPAGAVQFVFEVRNTDGVHTSRTVVRAFEQQMVASNVAVSAAYQLGSTLSVTMQPGSLKDLHTVAPFSKKNAAKREFVMDVTSALGTVVLTVPGAVVDSQDATYKFETTLPLSLDVIGQNTLSFRFVPAKPEFALRSVKLLPFDTAAHELYEDSGVHTFKVDAELHLSDVEAQPTKAEYTYGAAIPLKFKIRDALSGQSLVAGKLSEVFVALKSRAGDFESSRVVAVPDKNVFEVSVNIDANTLAGAASIVISAVTVDEVEVPILAQGSQTRAKYDVTIGGSIDVTSNSFSTATLDSTKTAVVITFALSCADKPLYNARLYASLLYQNGSGFAPVNHNGAPVQLLAVARDTSAAGAGSRYSVSFVLGHEEAKTGQYKVEFRRGVDLEQKKGDAGQVSSLFEIALAHKEVESSGVFIRMEIVTVLILGSLLLGIHSHVSLFSRKKYA